ncbi:M48 family metallopeptidase [Fodinicola acaciae]|uniref:M48 family metallopeptidase n=1 Tax=Fodinicola acaciae TaxID=2681555 RepID=UPI0013D002EE|nr:M48 family metallopeptidase [Fodinicola acaciae]
MAWSVGLAAVVLVALVAFAAIHSARTVPWHAAPVPEGGRTRPDPLIDFSDEERAVSRRYVTTMKPLAYASGVIGLIVPLVLGFTPLGAWLIRAVAAPFGGSYLAQLVVAVPLLALLLDLVTLPIGVRREIVRRRYGLSRRTWGLWLSDAAKGWLLSIILGELALLVLFALIWVLPQWWWLPAAAGAAILLTGMAFLQPLVFEPLFMRFTPLAEGPLRDRLFELAALDSVPVRTVLVADASRRTSGVNAYVSGFGASRRIVLFDTLLDDPQAQTQAELVVAHELGHAYHRDVHRAVWLGAAGAAIAACALFLALQLPWLLGIAGVVSAGDPAAIPLMLALAALGGVVLMPFETATSRRVEARADEHALERTGDPANFAAMQRQLAVRNLTDLYPSRFDVLFFGTHPSIPERIAHARDWARRHDLAPPAGLAS